MQKFEPTFFTIAQGCLVPRKILQKEQEIFSGYWLWMCLLNGHSASDLCESI